jgi:hypothetical protein
MVCLGVESQHTFGNELTLTLIDELYLTLDVETREIVNNFFQS